MSTKPIILKLHKFKFLTHLLVAKKNLEYFAKTKNGAIDRTVPIQLKWTMMATLDEAAIDFGIERLQVICKP
jgi:hypothetical protein